MRKSLAAILITILVVFSMTYFSFFREHNAKLRKQILEAEAHGSTLKKEQIGYTKYTDYIAAGKNTVSEHAKFLAASVNREYIYNQHVQRDFIIFKSSGLVSARYLVEYSFGYNLASDKFDLRSIPKGLQVLLGKPMLVSSPAVKVLSYDFQGVDLLVDTKTAALKLTKRLPDVALNQAQDLVSDPAIQALCEKKLSEFLRGFLEKQPGVTMVPNITIAYRK